MSTLQSQYDAGLLSEDALLALRTDPRAGVQRWLAQLDQAREAQVREEARLQQLTAFERVHWQRGVVRVAGVDEVGAGTLAGPVVAAAVILPAGHLIPGVNDSKQLTAAKREALARQIREEAVAWAIGACDAQEIDAINIREASRLAMHRAVMALSPLPEHVLVDAHQVPAIPMGQTALEGGDRQSQSIAAASILAKVERDAQMEMWHQHYPQYGFAQHRGYSTAEHLAALSAHGPTPLHRLSFAPVKAALAGMSPHKPKQMALF